MTVRRTLSRCCASSTSTPRAAPIEQALDLATVVVHTAAGSHTIPLLTERDAAELRDRIADLARTADEP